MTSRQVQIRIRGDATPAANIRWKLMALVGNVRLRKRTLHQFIFFVAQNLIWRTNWKNRIFYGLVCRQTHSYGLICSFQGSMRQTYFQMLPFSVDLEYHSPLIMTQQMMCYNVFLLPLPCIQKYEFVMQVTLPIKLKEGNVCS